MTALSESWLYLLIPIVVTVLGGVVAAFRTISSRTRALVQHLTAGVVFAALAGEAIPDVVHRDARVATVVGFCLGVALMIGIARLTSGDGEVDDRGVPWGLIVPLGIDALIDGLVIGIGLTAGVKVGTLIAVALSFEMFFLGLTTAATLRASGRSPRWVVAITSGAALMIGVGAVLGLTVLRGLSSSVLTGLLAFGCAALLYLVMEELLVDAHKEEEGPWATPMFFVGFLGLLVIEMSL